MHYQKQPEPHTPPHIYRVGDKAFNQDWQPLEIKDRKGWRYVVINRKQVGLSVTENKEGYAEPIYFNYLFGGGFRYGANQYYDCLIKNP